MDRTICAFAVMLCAVSAAADPIDDRIAAEESAVEANPLKNAYFGETHVHTSFSLDAYIGGARLTPFDAYRFARGETVSMNGVLHNIGRPLDFVAVSDHAEFLGELYTTQFTDAPGHYQDSLLELRSLETVEDQRAWFLRYVVENMRSASPMHPPFYTGPESTASAWRDVIVAAADAHYEPGGFTTFIAFEWSATQDSGNMHRNVIFRDRVVPDTPFDAFQSNDEEMLWAWMAEQEAAGSTLLAIPHNSNGSRGEMFQMVDNAGNPIDAEYATNRAYWEPLIEIMQIKGNSEVVAAFWPTDEFADFENAPSLQNYSDRTFRPENFVRWAAIKGMAFQRDIGANPFQYGFTGGTDNHNALPGDAAEDTYLGSHGPADGTVAARREGEIDGWLEAIESNPGALAGVWAPRNTRGDIFDAMRARESFATSGPRIAPRFFGGDLPVPESPLALVEQGYAMGVPMGGTLGPLDGPPTFTVHALKDPIGANLDRIQIIKGWVDEQGNPQERIINVVWSDDREPLAGGALPSLESSVDVATATYSNDIGATELWGSWTDDSFDPAEPAVYYVRVIEIPTPRWSTYDAVRHGLPLDPQVPATVQERAWTSPIWYIPPT